MVVDANDCIALANAQAANLLGVPAELMRPGTPLSQLRPIVDDSTHAGRILTRREDGLPPAGDFQVAEGRWLRISQSATRDGGFIVVCSDISHSKEQEASLRQINVRLDAALDNMSQGLCHFDGQNRLEVVNRRFFEIFGLSREQIQPGITFGKILELSEARWDQNSQTVTKLLAEQAEFISRHETGTHYYELSDGRVIASVYSPTSNGGWVATFEDVTERRQAEAQIMHMARHDALTDLPNRLYFRERIEQALGRGEQLAILFIDLDRFKTVNDTLGHPVGDELLCAVTKRLQMAVRGSDTVARLGGDEFAIVQFGAKPTNATELAVRDHRSAFGTLRRAGQPGRHRRQHRHRNCADRRQAAGSASAQFRYGSLSRQEQRTRHLPFLPAGNGRRNAGAPRARSRSSQGDAHRRIRELLSADRRHRHRQDCRLRGARALEPSAARARSRPTRSFRWRKKSA